MKTLRDPLWDQAETVDFSSSFLKLRVENPEAFEMLSRVRFRRDLRASRVTAMFPGAEVSYPARVEKVTLDLEKSFASNVVKQRILRDIEAAGEQIRLPLGEASGRANELAESQLMPSLDELLDPASGVVEFEVELDD